MTYYGIRDEVLDLAARAGCRVLPVLRWMWRLLFACWLLYCRAMHWLVLVLGVDAALAGVVTWLYRDDITDPSALGEAATYALFGVAFQCALPTAALLVAFTFVFRRLVTRLRRPEHLPDLPVPAIPVVQDTYQPVVTAAGALAWLPEGHIAAAEEVLALIDPPPTPPPVATLPAPAAASTGWGSYTRTGTIAAAPTSASVRPGEDGRSHTRTGTITASPTPIPDAPGLRPIECPRCGRADMALADGTCIPHTVPGQPTKVCREPDLPTTHPEDPR